MSAQTHDRRVRADRWWRLVEKFSFVLKFAKEKEAEGNRLIYSDEYGYGNRIKMAEAFSKNNKIYFSGETPLGAIFDQFMSKMKEEL